MLAVRRQTTALFTGTKRILLHNPGRVINVSNNTLYMLLRRTRNRTSVRSLNTRVTGDILPPQQVETRRKFHDTHSLGDEGYICSSIHHISACRPRELVLICQAKHSCDSF